MGVQIGRQVNPLFWALVDVTGDSSSLALVQEALLTALEALPPAYYFGLALIDEGCMYIMNWQSKRFHRVVCGDESDLDGMSEKIQYREVVQQFLTAESKEVARELISMLEPKPAKDDEKRSVLLGEAIKGFLKFLARAQEDHLPTHVGGRLVGTRLSVFLSRCPHTGAAAVSSMEDRLERLENQSEQFYLDPLNADIPMHVQSRVQSRDGKSLPLADPEAHKFFVGAGATAAVLGVAVDVLFVGENSEGLEAMAPLCSMSGGRLGLYGDKARWGPSLSEDLYKLTSRIEFLDCSIKVRTSPEVSVVGCVDGRVQEDSRHPDLLHAPRMCQGDGLGVLLDHKAGSGMSGRTPVCVQSATLFSVLRPSADGKCLSLHRYLRIMTYSYPLAHRIGDVFANYDVDVHLFLEFHSSMALACSAGKEQATSALLESLLHTMTASHRWSEYGEYIDSKENETNREGLKDKDILLGSIYNLAKVIRGDGEGAKDRAALLKMLHWSSCTCDDLRAAVYPRLYVWKDENTPVSMGVPLSKNAVEEFREQGAAWLLDTYDGLFLCGLGQKRSSSSNIMKYISSCRRLRIPTPSFSAIDSDEPPEEWYLDDAIDEGMDQSKMFASFTAFKAAIINELSN